MLLPAPLGPSTSVAWPASSGASALARLVAARVFSATLEHLDAHRRVGREPRSRAAAKAGRSRLLRTMRAGDAALVGGDQRARQLRFAEHRLGGDDDQQLVEVGGERLGLPLVLAVEQVAARQRSSSITPSSPDWLPADAVADDGLALLAAGWQRMRAPSSALDQRVPAVAGDDPALVGRRPSAEEGDEGIGLGGADEVVAPRCRRPSGSRSARRSGRSGRAGRDGGPRRGRSRRAR